MAVGREMADTAPSLPYSQYWTFTSPRPEMKVLMNAKKTLIFCFVLSLNECIRFLSKMLAL